MIERNSSVVFFSYIDGVSIFRSDIFTIATNRVMAPVIHRTKPSTVSCHSGTDTPLGRRSLVVVRERHTDCHMHIHTKVNIHNSSLYRNFTRERTPLYHSSNQNSWLSNKSESVYYWCCTMERMKINLYWSSSMIWKKSSAIFLRLERLNNLLGTIIRNYFKFYE